MSFASLLPALGAAQAPALRTTVEYRKPAAAATVCMSPLSDGGAYLVSTDGTLTRVDAQNAVRFTKTGLLPALPSGGFGFARCFSKELPGGEWAVGMNSGGMNLVMLKADGSLKFSKKLSGVWTDMRITAAPGGGILVAGNVERSSFAHDVQILLVDGFGITEWSSFVHWGSNNLVTAAAAAEGGGFVLAGSTAASPSPGISWIYRIDAFGDSVWTAETGKATGEALSAIAGKKGGGYLLGGSIPRLGYDNLDNWILDVDPSGKRRREFIYGERRAERILDIQELPDGDILVAGTTRPYLGSMETNIYHPGPYMQGTMSLLAPSGETRWSLLSLDTMDVNQVSCLSPAPGAFWMGLQSGYYWAMGKSLRYGAEGPSLLGTPGRQRPALVFLEGGPVRAGALMLDLSGRRRVSDGRAAAGMRILLPAGGKP